MFSILIRGQSREHSAEENTVLTQEKELCFISVLNNKKPEELKYV
jgi:hypothetical protein